MKYIILFLEAVMLLDRYVETPIFEATGRYAVVAKPVLAKRVEWYLCSEPWCQHCPAAKAAFLAKGWPEENIVTMAEAKARFGIDITRVPTEFPEPEIVSVKPQIDSPKPVVVSQKTHIVSQNTVTAPRYVNYGGRQYDMQTWRRQCSMRNCGMCNYLDQMAANYRASLRASIPDPQAPSPPDVIDEAIAIMKLTPSDVVAELGSGDGGPAIRMAKVSGCRVVGCEIDPKKVAESRENIEKAGLSDKITIIEGDVLDFDPAKYGITATYAYLDSLLLSQIVPALSYGRIAVCPGHKPEGLVTSLVGQCYVRN